MTVPGPAGVAGAVIEEFEKYARVVLSGRADTVTSALFDVVFTGKAVAVTRALFDVVFTGTEMLGKEVLRPIRKPEQHPSQ